jgi:hypothetical protein
LKTADRDRAIYDDFLRLCPQHDGNSLATRNALALRYGLKEPTVRKIIGAQAKLSRATIVEFSVVQRIKVPLPTVETYIYTGDVPPTAIPIFTGQWEFIDDECLIGGDFHLPTAKLGFIEKMCRFTEANVKKARAALYIVGDLHNGDKDAKHAKHIPPVSRAQEIDFTQQMIDYLLGYFDDLYITPGNHMRNRLIEYLEGDVNLSQMTRLLTTKPDRVKLSPYDIVHITSGGDRWTITHQYSYSKNKLVKANQLAQKYQSNVITFHQHHTAIGRDEFDRYTVVDCGGFHDQDMMGYVGLVPNTFPRMNNAFVFLREGTAHLMTPYRGITDWRLWLPDKAEELTRIA